MAVFSLEFRRLGECSQEFTIAFLLLVLGLGPSLTCSAQDDAAPQQTEEINEGGPAEAPVGFEPWTTGWVTSIDAVVGQPSLFAATAEGLLMRESAVVEVNADDFSKVRILYKHPSSSWSVVAGNGFVCSADYRGNLAIMNRDTGAVNMLEGVLERWTRALALSPDGQSLIAGNEAGKLFVLSLKSGETTKSVDGDGQQIYCFDFSPAGDRLLASDGGGHCHLYSWPELGELRKWELGKEPIWAARFCEGGGEFVAGGAERKIWQVSLAEGSEPVEIGQTGDWVTAITPKSGQQFIAATMTGQLYAVGVDGSGVSEIAKLPSGVWDVTMPKSTQILAATRKHAVAALGQAWSVQFAAEPSSEKLPTKE